ncbi:MAG: aldehyde dehydrogenase family protein [bacterium]|nr:aldehyde dehydrogenase family protein [bacterium]
MLNDPDLIAIQEARSKVEAAHAAWQTYQTYTQEQVDAIVERAAAAGRAESRKLAEMAVEETRYGNAKDKLAKNLLNADFLPRAMRGMKTIGLLREIPEQKVVEYAVPVGVVAAIIPTTNPTSTAISKILVALKSGNGIVLSPHPRAKNCTCYTAELLARAAVEAGAPEGIVQCLGTVTQQSTHELMRHPKTGVILATGGHGLVKAAYSSGKPAYGVGPGNVPVLLEKSADVAVAVAKVVAGKSFDYGTVCSSEQTLVTCRALRDQVLAELKKNKAYLANEAEAKALGALLISPKGTVNPECVGQAPTKIARMAGFSIPEDSTIIVAEIQGVGKEHPLSAEKLSPVLSLYFGSGFEESLDVCEAILRFGGLGHTCVIFSKDDARIRRFGERMPANRALVNTAALQGSVGLTTNVFPSMTLGCGAAAGNITSDNVGPQHLYNIKRLAYSVREPEEALDIPESEAAPAPLRAQVLPQPAGLSVSAEMVAAAVEKVMASRGLGVPAPAPESAAPVATVAADVVDRFLASKPVPQAAAPSCDCATTPAQESAEPEPEVRVVDFVCEKDVRDAAEEDRKIFISEKTIVTPSARESAAAGDILVLAKRS